MKLEMLTLGSLTFQAEADGPLFRVTVLNARNDQLQSMWLSAAEWASLVAIGDTMRAQQKEIERLTTLEAASLSTDQYRAAAILVEAANKTIERLAAERDLARLKLEVITVTISTSRAFFAEQATSDNSMRRELSTIVVNTLDRIVGGDGG